MRLGPDITRIAALLGDPARANMLSALMGGLSLIHISEPTRPY